MSGANQLALALGLVCALATSVVPAVPAVAAPAANCAQPPQDQATPWAQDMLNAENAWVLSRGGSRRIALLDSGVDAAQPQLAGRVDAGFDAVTRTGKGDTDCFGTGTEVAGVMVARTSPDNGLVGIAPDARVVPVRVVASKGFGAPEVDPAALARGITWAVQQQVDVICIPVAIYTDDPRVATAIQDAATAGIPVIAAVGDRGGSNDTNPPPYPASYPGVIGVGAIDAAGIRWQNSAHGGYVDISAPGAAVLTTWRGQGTVAASGTGIAAGFVAATAALVLRRWTIGPGQVRAQLRATALPSVAGPHSEDYGAGIVNPYGAVSELASTASPSAPPGYTPRAPSRAEQDWAAAWTSSHNLALVLGAVALGLVLLILVAAVAIPRGRRRSWRPTLAPPPVDRPEQDEPSPPVLLFDDV
ncbi:MAG TPA: S8 family serine peptidase [Rugosimonospora sp.]|nr:S8 family serine peptidase [Rugosimonospora sp.]